jgi:hypothetical protein
MVNQNKVATVVPPSQIWAADIEKMARLLFEWNDKHSRRWV